MKVYFPNLNYTWTITVPAGKTQASATARWLGHAGTYTVQVSYGGRTVVGTLQVVPVLASLVVKPGTVKVNQSWYVTATLTDPAPTGGASVKVAVQGTTISFSFLIQAGQLSRDSGLGWFSGLTAGKTYTVVGTYPSYVTQTSTLTVTK